MRILWFSVTPSLYNDQHNQHNGGGWIESLERIVKKHEEIQLGIAFCTGNDKEPFKTEREGTVYYPMKVHRSFLQRQKDRFSSKELDDVILKKCINVIEDFNPDAIHVFGSEWCFGLVKEYTDIPVVIHMQGCWPPYRNAGFPPGFSMMEKRMRMFFHPKKLINSFLSEHLSKERALREEHILRINDSYMGRTRWDKALTFLYNNQSHYYYCSEALRLPIVQETKKWNSSSTSKLTLVTIGAGHTLKGYDMVLKTARILKENMNYPFEWILCGPTVSNMKIYEQKTEIRCKDVCVKPLGRCSADEIKDNLLKSSLYVHPSYIDNSPNSVCEAQFLGLPIIATYVGGVPSLFSKSYPQDMLVPTNDPYYLAAKIIEVASDKKLQISMSEMNLNIAEKRHSDESIYKDLMFCYTSIINKNDKRNS